MGFLSLYPVQRFSGNNEDQMGIFWVTNISNRQEQGSRRSVIRDFPFMDDIMPTPDESSMVYENSGGIPPIVMI